MPQIIHKVPHRSFISYSGEDTQQVEVFWHRFHDWFEQVGIALPDQSHRRIASESPQAIRTGIRAVLDTTVATVVLVGEYAHRSRWIDWEIRVSLEASDERQPNALIGVLLDDEEKLKDRLLTRLMMNARMLSDVEDIPEDRYGLVLPYPYSYGVISQVMRNLYLKRAERARLIRNPRRVLVE